MRLPPGLARTGAALDNVVLRAEGRVTFLDGLLAVSVLVGLTLNTLAGWWWADPLAGLVAELADRRPAAPSLRPADERCVRAPPTNCGCSLCANRSSVSVGRNSRRSDTRRDDADAQSRPATARPSTEPCR
jgi:hypothetical protein